MKLMTKAILKKIPPLHKKDSLRILDAKIMVKFFTPWTNFTWYATEYDPETKTFFGLTDGAVKELGYFTLSELEKIKGPWGLKVERDMHFEPTKFIDCPETKSWAEFVKYLEVK